MCKIIQAHFSKLNANFWGKKITNLMIKAVKKRCKAISSTSNTGHFTYELFVVWFPLVESGEAFWTLAVFGTIMYLRPAMTAIDCTAFKSAASFEFFFGIAFEGSSFEICLLTEVPDADLLIKFDWGTFFIGRFWAANVSVEFVFLSSDWCSLFAVAASAFWAASIFSRLQCYTRQQTIETIRL